MGRVSGAACRQVAGAENVKGDGAENFRSADAMISAEMPATPQPMQPHTFGPTPIFAEFGKVAAGDLLPGWPIPQCGQVAVSIEAVPPHSRHVVSDIEVDAHGGDGTKADSHILRISPGGEKSRRVVPGAFPITDESHPGNT
jgi:hypothetical protein